MIPHFPRRVVVLIAATAIVSLSVPVGGFGEQRECPVPEHFYSFEPPVSKTAKALADGRTVLIVAVGGASTLGVAAANRDLAWPARLAHALTVRFRSARVNVVNLAVARQTAKAAAERLNRDVLPLKPMLVIWETGTMEAVRGTHVDEFRNRLQVGISEIRAAGAEVVLMNMQFSRDTDAIIDFEPYLIAMRDLADANDVPLFRRHDIMRHWAESGLLDLRARNGDKPGQLAAKLYDCTGRAMADFVTRGILPETPAAAPGPADKRLHTR
jgi:lysophospholipase L1-like esterase